MVCYNLVNIITVDITYNVIVKIEHMKERIVMPVDSIFNFHWIFIDKSHKRLSQKIKFVTTINEFLIDKLSPEQEIWLVTTEPLEPDLLWIESRVTQRRMDITVWEGITNNFKIEVIHCMVNTSNKFIVYNSNIEIQKVVTPITTSTAIQYQSIIVNVFWDGVKICQIYCAYIIQISAIIILMSLLI